MPAEALALVPPPAIPPRPPPAARMPVPAPSPAELAVAFAGFGALGLAAGLGSGDAMMAVRTAPAALFVGVGSLCLTGPALVVAHQFAGLEGRPEAVVGALARGFTTCGKLALGMVAPMLFFSATTSLWAVAFAFALQGIATVGFVSTGRRLVEIEPNADDVLDGVRVRMLIGGWMGLTALIGLRLAWDVAWFVVG
jgi:hypothetical protein